MMPYEFGGIVIVPCRDVDDEIDSELARILDLITRDIAYRRSALVPLSKALLARIERLTAGVTVDLDAHIESEVVL